MCKNIEKVKNNENEKCKNIAACSDDGPKPWWHLYHSGIRKTVHSWHMHLSLNILEKVNKSNSFGLLVLLSWCEVIWYCDVCYLIILNYIGYIYRNIFIKYHSKKHIKLSLHFKWTATYLNMSGNLTNMFSRLISYNKGIKLLRKPCRVLFQPCSNTHTVPCGCQISLKECD